ncbi:DNA alkylation repair protein [Lederbergia citrea]|uniref:DNA alkylation repair protein n=1 Tax=Lederbergia citrea TaxID=2833581 RepID=UPI001BC8EA8B|nr:DNA alkylation repair protein [Lederbergia citrea]MBS4179557.1 DNA alkylation repair protein [Lederbergia citrea]
MSDNSSIKSLVSIFEEHRNPENAVAMERYMKGLFPFIGIRAPDRKRISADWLKSIGLIRSENLRPFITKLWELPEREYQYIALDYLIKKKKHLVEADIDLLEYLIVTKSWWDTVDLIASHLVGSLFLTYPHFIKERGEKWLHSENIWLKRTMLLFQLKYKEQTNEQLLFSYIEQTSHIKEFFIQKAIGWSLREYAKTNPDAVIHFIESHDLSNLATREGLKHIRA